MDKKPFTVALAWLVSAINCTVAQGVEPVAAPYPSVVQSDIRLILETQFTFPYTYTAESPPSKGRRSEVISFDPVPGSDLSFANDTRGKLFRVVDSQPTLYLDLAAAIGGAFRYGGWAVGFTNIAFHSDFINNGLFYTSHAEDAGSTTADFQGPQSGVSVNHLSVVTEWIAEDPTAATFSGTFRKVLRIDQPRSNHPINRLKFNPQN